MSTDTNEDGPKPKTTTKELFCRLTQDEFNVRALEYAKLDEQLDKLEAEKSTVVGDFKDRIGGVEGERKRIRRVVLERREMREVQCTWHADWASRSMILRRDDTQEVVEARTMTPDEVQMSFDVTEPKNRRLPSQRQEDEPDEDGVIEQ